MVFLCSAGHWWFSGAFQVIHAIGQPARKATRINKKCWEFSREEAIIRGCWDHVQHLIVDWLLQHVNNSWLDRNFSDSLTGWWRMMVSGDVEITARSGDCRWCYSWTLGKSVYTDRRCGAWLQVGSVAEISSADFSKTMAINVEGPLFLTQDCWHLLIQPLWFTHVCLHQL